MEFLFIVLICTIALIIGLALLIWVEYQSRKNAMDEMLLARMRLAAKYAQWRDAYIAYREGKGSFEEAKAAEINLREYVDYYNETYSQYGAKIDVNLLIDKVE